MTREISIALQSHLDTRVTTYTRLLKIMPVNGDPFGLTTLDVDVAYDDGYGDGSTTYIAARGFNESALVANEGQGVDNAEAEILIADSADFGITRDQINSGYLDDARYRLYLVNYEDLSQGHTIIGGGPIGEIVTSDGLLGVMETRSWSQLAKQKSVILPTSLTCHATFGDATTGCYASVSWSATKTITGVGSESDRQFTASGLAGASGLYDFGLVEVMTGANAGKRIEVEGFTSGGIVSLAHPAPFAFANGDTFRIRQDCAKTFAACKAKGQTLNFRGLPHLPVADGDGLQTPGNLL